MTVDGTWHNELGSTMEITVNNGVLTGIYQTAVGDASGIYPLVGFVDNAPSNTDQVLGFVVLWNNSFGDSHSLTSWSGQYQIVGGAERLITTWLLTHETSPEGDWDAVNVGQDVFTRIPPTPETMQQARRSRSAAHPL